MITHKQVFEAKMIDPKTKHDPECEGQLEYDTVEDEGANPWPVIVGEHCDSCGYDSGADETDDDAR